MESFAFSKTEPDLNGSAREIAKAIWNIVFKFRRKLESDSNCDSRCLSCQANHLSKVMNSVISGEPVTFVLPAFPGKSPNLSKVLGPLPDMAERLALSFLEQLCAEIEAVYEPGARIIVCSDGRVFSDVVGMRETDVTAYQSELETMIGELGLTKISTFNLDELCADKNFCQVRRELMNEFGVSEASLREKVSSDDEARRMYLGITRFLVEDASFPGQTVSRTAIQKQSKIKALEVIRRSNAWSELIADRFPGAVRLSIHPQVCGSRKIGIRLVGAESWMTPWHGVAVRMQDSFILLKKYEAEALGAQLVRTESGRPSHYELSPGGAQ